MNRIIKLGNRKFLLMKYKNYEVFKIDKIKNENIYTLYKLDKEYSYTENKDIWIIKISTPCINECYDYMNNYF